MPPTMSAKSTQRPTAILSALAGSTERSAAAAFNGESGLQIDALVADLAEIQPGEGGGGGGHLLEEILD